MFEYDFIKGEKEGKWKNKMTTNNLMEEIFKEIVQERKRQKQKWGIQNHPMFSFESDRMICDISSVIYKSINDKENGGKSWYNILMEEIYEAFSEKDYDKVRQEFIQVLAVVIQIIEYLERNKKDENL